MMIYYEYRSIATFSQGLREVGLEKAAEKAREMSRHLPSLA